MKKRRIIILAKPYETYQQIFVYEDGNKIDGVKIPYAELTDNLFQLTEKYQVDRVDLTGPKQYVRGLAKQLEKIELSKYNKNSISFKVI